MIDFSWVSVHFGLEGNVEAVQILVGDRSKFHSTIDDVEV